MSKMISSARQNIHTTNNIQPGNRISWLDILRGIGILLMVYGHINYNVPVYTWIYSFHMPLFFFAAGIVYKEHPVREDVSHRARTILVPYVFYGLITLLYWQFAERHYKPSELSFAEAAKGLLIGNEDALDFNIPLWFLPCFFLTLVLYNWMRKMFSLAAKNASNSAKQLFSFVLCAGISVVYVFDLPGVLPWGIDRIPKYIIFVSLGEIAANVLAAKPVLPPDGAATQGVASLRSRVTAFIVAIPLLISSISLSAKLDYNEAHYQWFLVAVIGCAFVASLSIAISHCRILEYCGQSALLILCIHGPIYRALIYTLTHLTGKSMEWLRTTPIIITSLTLATVLGTLLLSRGVSLWLRNLLCRMYK